MGNLTLTPDSKMPHAPIRLYKPLSAACESRKRMRALNRRVLLPVGSRENAPKRSEHLTRRTTIQRVTFSIRNCLG
jgi:hypothetical protein